MQSKPRFSRLGMIAALVGVVLVGGFVALMISNAPTPQHPIEKQLDAKAFLEQKQ